VADFIGMSNRLELHRTGLEWTTAAGTELPLRCDMGDLPAVSARLWPDDITLHRADEDVSSREVVLDATLLSAEFGGRYYDVQVGAGPEQYRLRASSAVHGDWLRRAQPGEPVVISFRSESLKVYPLEQAASLV